MYVLVYEKLHVQIQDVFTVCFSFDSLNNQYELGYSFYLCDLYK
jgi:hypothetical protein